MTRKAIFRTVACAALLALSGCKTALDSGLSQMAANEEVALLLHNAIPAERSMDPKTNSWTVNVAQDRFADAVDLLRAHGLPHAHYDSIPDVFKGNGLVTSPTEERARMMYALGEELAKTISEIDGVLSARVHIVTQDSDPLRENAPPASASVFVRYKAGTGAADLVPQIKSLVADGVSGLTYDKVSVVTVAAAVSEDKQAGPSAELQDVYGLWVESGSAGTVRLIASILAGLAATAFAACGLILWRLRERLPLHRLNLARLPDLRLPR